MAKRRSSLVIIPQSTLIARQYSVRSRAICHCSGCLGLISCERGPKELRKQNVAAIKEARRAHKESCSDADGYDLIAVPEVRARQSQHVLSLSATAYHEVLSVRTSG